MDHAGKRDHAGEREHAGAREHGGAMGGMMDAERSGRHEGNMHGGNKASMKSLLGFTCLWITCSDLLLLLPDHQEGCDIDDPKERARMNAEHGAM